MSNFLEKNFDNISNNFVNLKKLIPIINEVAEICTNSLKYGNKIMFCGNGGSASDSQHLAAELVGRYKMNRKAYNSIALTTDTSILTAVGNDFGYDEVFERQVEGIGEAGDILFGLSTSGNSKNVMSATVVARALGIKVIGLTGAKGGELATVADVAIKVPETETYMIQELHLPVYHCLCLMLEDRFFGGND